MSVEEKRQCIEPQHSQLSVERQCELLGLSRASYYRELAQTESEENLALMRRIDELYTRYPFYGTRKMRDHLRREGYKVNRKRVQRLMRKMGLVSIAPQPNTSRPAPQHKVYPYLLNDLAIERANQVWCSDVTYIRMRGGFVYLTVVMDWHSRYVLSWELSVNLEEHFCVNALESALRRHECSTPAKPSRTCSRPVTCASAWMAKAERWTTSWSSACGARSSTRRSTPRSTPL